MKKIALISLLVIFPFTYSYANDNSFYLEKARNSSKSLLGTLKNTLEENLKLGNTFNAFNVCSSIAQNMANNIAKTEDIYIKRVSLKYRNLNDKPDKFEEEKLNFFEELKADKKLNNDTEVFEKIKEGDKYYFRYMKPIIANKSCLQCHGLKDDIKPEISKLLKEKYPNDLAINHKEGDIRGAVTVKISVEEDE